MTETIEQPMPATELQKQLGKSRERLIQLDREFADAENRMSLLSDEYLSGRLKSSDQLTTQQSRLTALGELRETVQSRISELENDLARALAIENRENNMEAILAADADSQAAFADYNTALLAFDAAALEFGKRLAGNYVRIIQSQNSYVRAANEMTPENSQQTPAERERQLDELFDELVARGFNGNVVRHHGWQPHLRNSHAGLFGAPYPASPTLKFGNLSWALMVRVQQAAANGPEHPDASEGLMEVKNDGKQ